jgi:uncharacterized SAM-binding protein YcdF (DUF218 family)
MRLLSEPNSKPDSRMPSRDPRTQNMFTRQARLRGSIIALVIGLLVLPLLFGGANTTGAVADKTTLPPKLSTLVCVVSGEELNEMSMDAVVIVEGGKLLAPFKEYDEADRQRFAKEYFREGQKYRLTFGGGEIGVATVRTSGQGCNNIHAKGTVETSAKIHGQVMALATNSESLGRKPSARRAPADAERAAVMDLVKQIYRSKGTTALLLRRMQTTNLTATDLDGDGKFELVGSFVIETKAKARRDLFLIAEPQGNGYKAALVNYQPYKLPPEGFDSAIKFVDQLDLDGDGTGEVFAIQGGFDAYGYLIYRKQAGRWRKVYDMIGDAC